MNARTLAGIAALCAFLGMAVTIGRAIAGATTHDGAWFIAVLLGLIALGIAVALAGSQSNTPTKGQ